ncbi:ACT domain-containing protein [Labrys neptuniae]
MPHSVRDTGAMIAGMTPRLKEGDFVFCTTTSPAVIEAAARQALSFFREEEGVTLILLVEEAATLGFDTAMAMKRIELEVFSALDGVGLTAAVASALADAGIPCNMVAAYHHDHVFVPAGMAERAVAILEAAQRQAAG